jgi:hypothetical protein
VSSHQRQQTLHALLRRLRHVHRTSSKCLDGSGNKGRIRVAEIRLEFAKNARHVHFRHQTRQNVEFQLANVHLKK